MEPTPWNDREIEPEKTPIIQVGFLLRSDPEWITLYSATWNAEDRQVLAVMHIPRGCIKRMVPIAPPQG
jgi:hypothetical protein